MKVMIDTNIFISAILFSNGVVSTAFIKLRAAILSNVDYILTGDKDFLEAHLTKPIYISASDFINLKSY